MAAGFCAIVLSSREPPTPLARLNGCLAHDQQRQGGFTVACHRFLNLVAAAFAGRPLPRGPQISTSLSSPLLSAIPRRRALCPRLRSGTRRSRNPMIRLR